MKNTVQSYNLSDCDHDDISEAILQVGSSFAVRFHRNAFKNVVTFGDLVNVFEQELNSVSLDDCTKQQVFYRIRRIFSETLAVSKSQLHLDTKLEAIFPKTNRRRKVAALQCALETKIPLLTFSKTYGRILSVCMLLSVASLFLKWELALLLFITYVLAYYCGQRFGDSFKVATIKDLVLLLVKDDYTNMRSGRPFNKNEVFDQLADSFSYYLQIDKTTLTGSTVLFS